MRYILRTLSSLIAACGSICISVLSVLTGSSESILCFLILKLLFWEDMDKFMPDLPVLCQGMICAEIHKKLALSSYL